MRPAIETTPTQFPGKLRPLFRPHRYKVAKGGRGSGKSWGFARALLIKGVSHRIRVLCARETQKSIKESVHKLLKDQIEQLQLGDYYEVLATEIRGKNGTEFSFTGLSDQTADSLKSYEGVDYCWVEEAHVVTETSWRILIPTIRAAGSEIWVTFNPQLETDPTYQRFIVNKPDDCVVMTMNHDDNPWFDQTELPAELAHARQTMSEEEFAHVWGGHCLPAVEGAIYFKAMTNVKQEGRICRVPHDPMLKVHLVWDLGFNDCMAIGLVQRHRGEVRIIDYIEDRQRTLSSYSKQLKEIEYGGERPDWGTLFLPHDGHASERKTGRSDADILTDLGWDVWPDPVPNISIRAGISRAQQMFPRVVFDEVRTERLVVALSRYRWNINSRTLEGIQPLHDEYSHGSDMFRYIALAEDNMRNEDADFTDRITYTRHGYA